MVSLERWKNAQDAELRHQSHSEPNWDAGSYLDTWFDKDVSFYEGKSILEVGSGTGMIHTLDIPGQHVGIDPLSSEFANTLDSTGASVLTGVGESLPFETGSFDVVASHNVLDHCQNPGAVLEEAFRVMKSGGHLVMHVNVFALPMLVRERLHLVDRPHPYHFSEREVLDMIEEVGFDIEQTNYRDPEMSLDSLKRFVATGFLGFGRVYVLAKKHENGVTGQ